MISADLHEFLAQLETDSSLFAPDQLRRRLDALDELDAEAFRADPQEQRVTSMRRRLEAANAAVYEAIRHQILHGSARDALMPWIERCAGPATTASGLGYECLDELIGGVLQLHEPDAGQIHPGPEMVFYQPTPARHILYLLRLCALTEADVLIDLGSGLGHVPLLASLLTGARSIGIEMESAYVATARACAQSLGLNRAAFLEQDARDADLSSGTVFYLYTPFIGSILDNVLHKLRRESAHRPVRICTFGPCTQAVAREPWLTTSAAPEIDRIAFFRSRN
jgi:hypothetical protein